MAKLVYSAIVSLDGYTADGDGDISWAAPDPEVHAFINELERDFGTYLYGRRMYETMQYWETFDAADAEPHVREFAGIWRAASKVVYSTTLRAVSSDRTRIERAFEPSAVQAMKAGAGSDLSVGGAELASQAIAAGLVDEVHLFVTPVMLGRGAPGFASDLRATFDLLDVDRFTGGVVHLLYGTTR